MAANKIVARFNDGRLVKGSTHNFDAGSGWFHLIPEGANPSPDHKDHKLTEVRIRDLKAIFFVDDFAGHPKYQEKRDFSEATTTMGRRCKVTFKDGEVISGFTLNYDPGAAGFFMIPADPQSNNKRIFVINASLQDVELL
jgi:hypothetical protein